MCTDNQALTDHPSSWGQLLMVGIPGPRVDAVARELVRDLKVGGVILFARNIESPEQVWELTRDLQREALAATGRPLLLAVDQEGGRVQRLKAPFTIIPAARELGITMTPEEVEYLARQVARELALVGLNVNLAPVLDVPRSPACPQWDRAYSSDPETGRPVTRVAAIRGYLAGGDHPGGQTFPGAGGHAGRLPRGSAPGIIQRCQAGSGPAALPAGDSRGGAHGHDRPSGRAGVG